MKGQRRIYLAQKGRGGPIKIGMSCNVIQRTKALGHVCILAVIDGSRKREMELHKQFEHLALGHEWFQPGRELIEFVNTLPSPHYALSTMPGYERHGLHYRLNAYPIP